jgi:beta-galactosidase
MHLHKTDRLITLCLLFLSVVIYLLFYFSQTIASTYISDTNLNLKKTSLKIKSRIRYTINECWRFKFLNEDIPESKIFNCDKNSWSTITIPHTWNINEALDDTSGYRRGSGWYFKRLFLNNNLKNKKLFLHFEGANQLTDVYVNSKKVGQHKGGYTAFTFDITEYLAFDDQQSLNIIAVKVDNRFNKNIPPLSADFTFYGGIYRDVWLIAANPVHITMTDHGSPGIFISTPEVTQNKAKVNIQGTITNETNKLKGIKLINTIVDSSGQVIQKIEEAITLQPKTRKSFNQTSQYINSPRLWSPDFPYLYSVYTKVIENNHVVDIVKNPLGFRWFSLDPQNGFNLNGKQYRLIGTNRHQDYEGMGNALPNEIHESDLKIIKENGFNFLRLAHYPQDPAVLAAADKLGLIIWEEIPVVNYVTCSDTFQHNCEQMLKEMIRQNFNHPSVLMWGYMNEIFLHDVNGKREKNFPEDYIDWTVKLAQTLENLLHKEDPSRISVMAIHQSSLYNESKIAKIPQALGYNLYPGWYGGKLSDFGDFLDKEHEKYPERLIMVSEYGAGSDERLHSANPIRFDFTVEYQQRYHESYLSQILVRPYLCATALWNQFDFGSAERGDSKPKINQKGIFFFDRSPKDISYYYKAVLCNDPVLRIASHEWTNRTENCSTAANAVIHPVKVYTNLDTVELFLNNKPPQTKELNGSNILTWDVPFQNGLNVLEARGTKNGVHCSDKVNINVQLIASTLNDQFDELAVNVGATFQFTDKAGRVWIADRPYSKGNWGYIGGKKRAIGKSKGISGTSDDPLYQTTMDGIESYRFDVPDGEYEVEIRMVENVYKHSDKRKFDIWINDLLAFRNLDLANEYGYLHAVSRKFIIHVNSGQGIELKFQSQIGEVVLSSIRVKKL